MKKFKLLKENLSTCPVNKKYKNKIPKMIKLLKFNANRIARSGDLKGNIPNTFNSVKSVPK